MSWRTRKTSECSFSIGEWERPLFCGTIPSSSFDFRYYFVCRQQRMAEMMAMQKKAKFGTVKDISAVDYVDEVNKAGDGVWVVLHLYKSG